MAMSSRTVPQIWWLADHIDGVIAPYYLLVHLCTDGGIGSIRLLSVLGLAVTVGALVALAHLLNLPRSAAFAVAAVVMIVPTATRYGQEARPYALSMAAATVSTLCLVGALTRPTRTRGWWIGYCLATVVLGYLHVVALLILAAHAVSVLMIARSKLPALIASAVGVVFFCLPMILVGSRERDAVAWLTIPTLDRLMDFPLWLFGSTTLARCLAGPALAGVAYSLLRGRHEASGQIFTRSQRWTLAIAGPWLIVPPVMLFVVGRFTPMYGERYLIFCLPAGALVIGLGLSLLPRWSGLPVLLLAALIAFPAQSALRRDTAHGENPRGVAELIAADKQPGDGVFFAPGNQAMIFEAYPRQFAGMHNPLRDADPASTGWLVSGWVPLARVASAVEADRRVWVVTMPRRDGGDRHPVTDTAVTTLEVSHRRAGSWQFPPYRVDLYQRP